MCVTEHTNEVRILHKKQNYNFVDVSRSIDTGASNVLEMNLKPIWIRVDLMCVSKFSFMRHNKMVHAHNAKQKKKKWKWKKREKEKKGEQRLL